MSLLSQHIGRCICVTGPETNKSLMMSVSMQEFGQNVVYLLHVWSLLMSIQHVFVYRDVVSQYMCISDKIVLSVYVFCCVTIYVYF
jgi:hypothetical protein